MSKVTHLTILLVILLLFKRGFAAFAPSLRHILPISQNKILNINTTCDETNLNVTVVFEQPFKGLLFAKDFSQECGSIGTLSNIATIHLPTSGCGVKLNSKDDDNEDEMYFTVILSIQQDRHLRQISDQEKLIECNVKGDLFSLSKSRSMVEEFKNELIKMKNKEDLSPSLSQNRSGRMKHLDKDDNDDDDVDHKVDDDIEQINDRELNDALSATRAWMQVIPAKDESQQSALQVGEPALLMVKATLPIGIGWNVVDCNAHDGLGESSQKLFDEYGCPLDEMVMPGLLKGPTRPMAMMKHQEAVSKFVAFKFPDRNRLHLACTLILCRGSCEKVNCTNINSTIISRFGKNIKVDGEIGEVLDKLEIFNSVEVIAPEIELDDDEFRNSNNKDPLSKLINLKGDKTFCVSPNKIAITFCILGLIFLSAIVISVCALLRSSRRYKNNNGQYYTRSLFSSSSGCSGASGYGGGSKLFIRDSPTSLIQQSNRNFPYGKMF